MDRKKIFIIAEVGNLHDGNLDRAKKLAFSAAKCGADAVKFQTHIFNAESLDDAPNPSYFTKESRKNYFERTAFSKVEWKELKEYVEVECEIEFMSSVFSKEAFDLLESIGVERHKIPSGEVTNIPLLKHVAIAKKSVLLSSGMSTWAELDLAINTLKNNGCADITVFQCSSIYPCSPKNVGLNILDQIKDKYGLAVGLSDHTFGMAAAIAAIIKGANIIEKHFTLSTDQYGSDAKHSLPPDEFRRFVKEIRELELMLNFPVDKDGQVQSLSEMKVIFEKSIVSKIKIEKGQKIIFDMLSFKKPGDGIRADRYQDILGRIAKVDIDENTKIKEEMLER